MSKARTLANLISDNAELADGQISVAEVVGAAPTASPSFTGNITVSGNVDGRDIAADGTKLDGVEASADVTDATNVTAAGALMDSELTNIAAIKALNQGVATTDEVAFDNTTLNAIAKDISDTAVDVFVYDTSKDSDGGAWRKRTQGTSWYNETLNTATRGSRKEFPAVAVIVAESSQVTIYDGDDPDLPMWMVFNAGGGSFSDHTYIADSSSVDSLGFINAQMVVGNSSGYGIFIIDFLKETSECLRGSDEAGLRGIHTNVGIANRNTNSGEHQGTLKQLASNSINDISMTVLPNAPIDAATGLPVPTIAVATDGGVSVIKDDGNVYDITNSSSTYTASYHVSFDSKNNLWFHQGKTLLSYHGWVYVYSMPLSGDTAITINSLGATGQNPIALFQRNGSGGGSIEFNLSGGDSLIANTAIGNDKGIGVFDLNTENPYASMAFQSTSDFNTGWQVGDSKLATLSDTDDTNAGAELVTNGDFASDSNWTKGSGWTISGGKANHDSTGGNQYFTQTGVITAGKQYVLSFTISNYTSGTLRIYVAAAPIDITEGNQTYTIPFTASSGAELQFQSATTGPFVGSIDNVSVKLAEQDRSVNGNGLQVFGTVTKSAVATGADLVAYSGFASGTYLRQPYNADLQFGTNPFSTMGWYKATGSSGSYRTLVYANTVRPSGGNIATGQEGWQILLNDQNKLYYYIYGPNDDANVAHGSTTIDGNWHFFCAVTENNSSHKLYVDGDLVASATNTVGNLNNSLRQVEIGAYGGTGNSDTGQSFPFSNGSLCNIRISATAPSPEQIKKIYNDEKVLFQENAKATLYGTADAVTALAHDDTTDLLHVGTSAGRSVFQGLRRVDNTTTAVGAAISASNGLVAED
jgi:hypothetical protein